MFGHIYFINLNLIVPFWTWSFLILSMVLLVYVFFKVTRLRENKIREIVATKIELEKLRSENFKARLEREQINNFFSTSLLLKNDVDEILWDVTKNLKIALFICGMKIKPGWCSARVLG